MRTWLLRPARPVAGLLLAVTAAACGGPAAPGGTAAGSCAGGGPAAAYAAARVVFTGIMLPGPATGTGAGGILISPARVRVVRYRKGSGPAVVTVITAVTVAGGRNVMNAEGIAPQAGQRWTIYATSRSLPYRTSVCAGSRPAGAPE